jgi:hypothetical protein
MRAATVIVGAIAFSSCLIALAFLFSGHDSGASPKASAGTSRIQDAQVRSGELVQCNREGAAFSVEGVTCRVGAGVEQAYSEGFRGTLEGKDPESGETIRVTCTGTAPVICSGKGGIKIYFAPAD